MCGSPVLSDFGGRQLKAISATVASSTAAAYERGWRLRVLPTLGDFKVSDIMPGDVEEAYALWTGEPSTKNDALACLSRVLHRARRDGLITRNPVRDIELPRGSRHSQHLVHRSLSPQQLTRMWDHVPKHYHLLIGFMIYGGLRLGEAAAVQGQFVDLEDNTVFVQWQRYRNGNLGLPKGNKTRVVPLRPQLRELLLAAHPQLRDAAPATFLCTTPKGSNVNNSNLERALNWDDARRRFFSESPAWRFHDFRHQAATSFLADGLPVNDVMEIMGHSSLQVTTRYVRSGKDAARRAVTHFYPHDDKEGGRSAT